MPTNTYTVAVTVPDYAKNIILRIVRVSPDEVAAAARKDLQVAHEDPDVARAKNALEVERMRNELLVRGAPDRKALARFACACAVTYVEEHIITRAGQGRSYNNPGGYRRTLIIGKQTPMQADPAKCTCGGEKDILAWDEKRAAERMTTGE